MTKQQMLELKNWVVVGDVLNESKYAHRILKRLKDRGYEAVGVHPRGGEGIYTALKDLPQVPDMMCLVINPATGLGYLEEAKEMGIKGAWLQPGADTHQILAKCESLGLEYVQACVLVETSR